MIYIVLVPAWLWTVLLLASWSALAFTTHGQSELRQPLLFGLLAAMAVQAIAAASAAIATSQYAIGNFACTMGIAGTPISLVATLTEAIILVVLFQNWPQNNHDTRVGFKSWVMLWFLFQLLALLAHLRSAALCTV